MARKKEVFGVTVDGDISGLKSAMNDAVRVFNSTERSIKNIDKALKLDPSNLDLLKKKQELCNKAIQDGEKALEDLRKAQEDIVNDANYKSGKTDLTERYSELQLKITQVVEELQRLKTEQANMPKAEVSAFINEYEELGKKLQDIGDKTRTMSRAFQVMLEASFNSAVQYEEQIAGIKKIVSDLSDDTIQELKDIAVDTGTAFEQVAEYATFTGALGVAEEDIAKFTKTMIDLNTATNGAFSGEEGAKGIVVFLNNLGISVDEASNFGSAISEIGDAMADVGDETLQMAIALAGLSTISDVSQYDLIGLAGVMKNLGLRTSTSSNSLTKSFMAIETSIATGDEKLKTFARTAGMTANEFTNAWNNNATDTFLRFVDGIKSSVFDDINSSIKTGSGLIKDYADALGMTAEEFKLAWNNDSVATLEKYIAAMEEMDENSENSSVILKELGLSGVRVAETLLKLSGQGDNVRDAISLANDAWNKNTALTDKANVMYETTSKKLDGVKEAFKQAGSSLMDDFLPIINNSLDFVKDFVKGISDLPPITKDLIAVFSSLAAAYSPVTKAGGKFYSWFANQRKALSGISLTAGSAVTAVVGLTTALAAYGYAYISNDPMVQLTNSTKELRNAYEELSITSDENYSKQTAMLLLADDYIQKIDELNKELQSNTLNEEDAGKVKEQLATYIDSLNNALGQEEFSFDSVTGKILYQGQEVDNLTEKYVNLAGELKKEAWLESHKDSLTQAYQLQENAANGLVEVANYYQQEISKIPQTYVDLYEQYNEDILKIQQALSNGDISEEEYKGISNLALIYDEYKRKVQSFKQDLEDADQTIANYQLVSETKAEEIDSVLSNINTSVSLFNGELKTSTEQLEYLQNARDNYLKTLEEDQLENDNVLQKYDEQIKALEEKIQNEQAIVDKVKEQNQERENGMTTWDNWTAIKSYKDLVVRVSYEYENSAPNTGDISVINPFGMNSGGFGDLLSQVNRTMYNHHSNEMSSGGFSAGGITLNANFNITNGNSINENVVRGWAGTMIDMINEELGGKL